MRPDRIVVGSSVERKFADLIRVVPGKRLEIDGEEFPWHITEDGPIVSGLNRQQLRTVTVSIICERIVVEEEQAE